MPCQGPGLSLEGSGEPPLSVECGLGREKIRSVFILLTGCSTEEGLEYWDAGRPGRTLRTVEEGLEG